MKLDVRKHIGIIGMLLGGFALFTPAAVAAELYSSQGAFESATGAAPLAFPGSADTAFPDKPFGTDLLDYSCTPEGNPVIALPWGATEPAARIRPMGPGPLCFLGPGWNAGPANIDPQPASPTIVADGEDDFTMEFPAPVHAVGFELLTNASASETIELFYADGSSETFTDAALSTAPNSFGFVGFRSLKPIAKVTLNTEGGAIQNEGVVAVKVAGRYQVVIDIKPGSYPNSINLKSRGKTPVAVCSSPEFDPTSIDPATIELAGAGVVIRPNGTLMYSYESLDYGECAMDSTYEDLVIHVDTQSLAALPDDTALVLTAITRDGVTEIIGMDSIRLVPGSDVPPAGVPAGPPAGVPVGPPEGVPNGNAFGHDPDHHDNGNGNSASDDAVGKQDKARDRDRDQDQDGEAGEKPKDKEKDKHKEKDNSTGPGKP